MAWTYQVEYRLGPRNVRVSRTFGGVRALLAIGFDLLLALVFGMIGLVLRAIRCVLWLAWQLVRLVALTLREIVGVLARFARSVVALFGQAIRPSPRPLPGKPAWVALDEL